MKTLSWKRTDWSARNFVFSIGEEIVGQLNFNSAWNFNAVYNDQETNLKFSQKNFWSRGVLITKDGKLIGEIKTDFFFKTQTLKLLTGETFILSSNCWGRNVNWKNDKGETLIAYQQRIMSAMGEGLISSNNALEIETEKLLVSTGLFLRQLMHKRLVLVVVIMIPLWASSGG